MNFAVSEKQFVGTVEKIVKGEMFGKLVHSTESLFVRHFQSIFEDLWNSAIDAKERMDQIESGIGSETTKVIENHVLSKSLFLSAVENAKEEILILFPTIKAVKMNDRIGIVDLLKQKSHNKLKVRVLSPQDNYVKQILSFDNIIGKDHQQNIENFEAKEIAKQQQNIKSTIVMVDKKQLLSMELKDDINDDFEEPVGLTVYSTSKPTIFSFMSIFESLWRQTEMYTNERIAKEKLIQSEQMEKEFINTAAHELRTPIQAITGFSELNEELFSDLLNLTEEKNTSSFGNKEIAKLINQIYNNQKKISKNSSRIHELINNLLDIARFESSGAIYIYKEKMDLTKEINNLITDELDQKIKNKNITINYIKDIAGKESRYFAYADKLRLNQILNNLLDNAIKFSYNNSSIDIIITENYASTNDKNKKEQEKDVEDGNRFYVPNKEEIQVAISDLGKGISTKIMPRIFEKFVSYSESGTGLGLYITRKLVEAHGGKIWAENNKDGKGATFSFSIPSNK